MSPTVLAARIALTESSSTFASPSVTHISCLQFGSQKESDNIQTSTAGNADIL